MTADRNENGHTIAEAARYARAGQAPNVGRRAVTR
jgi:hypothetical protein